MIDSKDKIIDRKRDILILRCDNCYEIRTRLEQVVKYMYID